MQFRGTTLDENEKQNLIRRVMDPFLEGVQAAFRAYLGIAVHADPTGVKFSKTWVTDFRTIACLPFSGAVAGEFFVCVDQNSCVIPFAKATGIAHDDKDLLPLLHSTLQEIINTAAGNAIGTLRDIFGAVTLLSPRLIEGKIYYPATYIYSASLEETSGAIRVDAKASFDLMQQQIHTDHERLKSESKLDDTGLFNKKYFL